MPDFIIYAKHLSLIEQLEHMINVGIDKLLIETDDFKRVISNIHFYDDKSICITKGQNGEDYVISDIKVKENKDGYTEVVIKFENLQNC